jgi:tRNA modification GTPase
VITRARHREGLEDCLGSLERALAGLKVGRDSALVAEDLRMAMRALGRITGRVDVEDLLDVVFRDFCIGK